MEHLWQLYMNQDYTGCYEAACSQLAQFPFLDLQHLAGMALLAGGDVERGLVMLRAVAAFEPEAVHIYANPAVVCEQRNLPNEVAYFAERGLRIFPNDGSLHALCASAYMVQMRLEEADELCRRFLARDPNHLGCLVILANVSRLMDRFDEALALFDRIDELSPNNRNTAIGRAGTYAQMADSDKAIEAITPLDDPDGHYLLAMNLLNKGNYEQGWQLHRARWQSKLYRYAVAPTKPFDRIEDARGKRVAVIREGGYGDIFQFMRFLPRLSAIAAHVTLFVPDPVLRLLNDLPDNVKVLSSDRPVTFDEYNGYDLHTTLMELPAQCGTTVETIPCDIPYITAPDAPVALPPSPAYRVGLVWAGGATQMLNVRDFDSRRSIDPHLLTAWGDIRNVEFVSLQQTIDKRPNFPLTEVLKPTDDFAVTAAIIQQLDLVISVDTSVAHLAGAMGKPVWLLSRSDCCWRWLQNQPTSPWYPTMRIFGQREYRNWQPVIEEVRAALCSVANAPLSDSHKITRLAP